MKVQIAKIKFSIFLESFKISYNSDLNKSVRD